LLWLWPWL